MLFPFSVATAAAKTLASSARSGAVRRFLLSTLPPAGAHPITTTAATTASTATTTSASAAATSIPNLFLHTARAVAPPATASHHSVPPNVPPNAASRPSATVTPTAGAPCSGPASPAICMLASSSGGEGSMSGRLGGDVAAPRLSSRGGDAAAPTATPRQLGFRMPGEFEPHAGTWMAFPYDPYLWRDGARPAQQQHAALARTIAQFEQVWVLADPQVYDVACGYFRDASGVEVIRVPTNDVWARDWGPSCVVRDDPSTGEREVAAVHFDFNCYGSPVKMERGLPPLLPDWFKDRAAGRSLPQRAGLRRTFECPLHLEGGAVQSDGEGTVLVTEECLMHFSRDPHLGRGGIEALLREYLGAEVVLWLPGGMVGDEQGTNGHVDNVAAFAAPGTVLLAWYDNAADDPRLVEVCEANLAALERQTDARGRHMRVVKVPCPHPLVRVRPEDVNSVSMAAAATAGYATCQPAGCRLPASYLNLYVVNGGVVVPQFGGEQSRSDSAALEAVAAAFPPGHRVVGAPSRELLQGGGNVHCLTQNLPASRPVASG